MQQVRTRFAPSPTGYMHLGNLRTALYTYLYARSQGGKFILRIEDTDQEREVPGAVDVIYNSMRTAGLSHDEGPDVGGPCGPYVQSQRKDTYMPYAKQLVESGHAYYCFCTKERLDACREAAEKQGQTFKYDKHCLHLTKAEVQAKLDAGEPWVIRQNIPTEGKAGFDDVIYGHVEVDCDTLDDNVLIKADGLPTYNFANVIDDHLMGITHVMRGMEYLSSTPRYNYLYRAFGWDIPEYIHLPTVMRDETHKLSKRDGDAYYSDYIDKGYLTEALINYLALVGWNPGDEREFFTLPELVEAFDVHRINKSPGIFDVNKLRWFNAEYIRRMTPERYLELATPWFDKALAGRNIDYRRLAELMQKRTEIFSQVPDMVRFLAELPDYTAELFNNKNMKVTPAVARTALELCGPVLEAVPEDQWQGDALYERLCEAIAAADQKKRPMLWSLAAALAGQQNTPGGATDIACLLGKEETLRRLALGREKLADAE